MNYDTLTPQAQLEIVKAKVQSLENEHYRLVLDLKVAEANLEAGVKGAHVAVIELNKRLRGIELSAMALSKLITNG